jgi:AcrR family transcriptional regulator
MDDRIEARIIAKTAEHLRLQGAEFLRVTAVARDLDMTHANIYRHFANKAELIDQVIASWLKSIEKRLRDIVDSPDPADDKLERFFWVLATSEREKCHDDPQFFKVFREAWLSGKESIVEFRATLRRLIERILEEGLEPGPFRIKSMERAVAFTGDAFHRFFHPETLFELKDLTRAQFDQRLLSISKSVLNGLRNNYI